ncbi:hypothetical protein [Corynebacterium uterequi]|uniref:Uncharacterized protein n=1 Tax=Corynebacterium uterequi TaxID=1072256 RepID=A0A0G3HCR2_9CORY|nr:hypothetical protein [Corynebacterium uterequi]AKK11131.1 hypothetical protein CUTER_05675 [Corynebacterium uterequi]
MKHNQDWPELDLESLLTGLNTATGYATNRVAKPHDDADYDVWISGELLAV